MEKSIFIERKLSLMGGKFISENNILITLRRLGEKEKQPVVVYAMRI